MWSHLKDVWVAAAFSSVLMRGKWAFQSQNTAKRSYVKRLHAAIEGGENILSRQSDFLFTKHKCFGHHSEMPRKIFDVFQSSVQLGIRMIFWEHCPWRMRLLWGCTSGIENLFPKFQPPSLNTSCLGMLCPQQRPPSDGHPIVLVWQAAMYLWFLSFPFPDTLHFGNNAALKKTKPI